MTVRLADGRAIARIAVVYGVLCHLTFIIGVGAMIAMMFLGMSRSLGALGPPFRDVADAALLLQFPLAHSFLLTRRGRRLLSEMAPLHLGSSLSTTTYALIASVQIAVLFLGWSPTGSIWWQAKGWPLVILTIAYASSWILLLKAIVDAGYSQQIGLLGWWSVVRRVPVRYVRTA